MKGVKALTLHGVEYSSFCVAVELALELKGLEYEYVQEDLANKSEALLRYNPIHKKVPILVHHGKPIAESLVILEYIEETWKEPPLLPSDPYKRARVRFWIDFYYHKLVATSRLVFDTKSMPGDLRKIGEEIKAHFMTMEEDTKMDFPGEGPFFHGDKPGLLDVLMAPWGGWFVALRGITGVEVARKETTPFILSSITAFESLDVARGRLSDHDKMLEYAQALKARTLLPNTVS